VIRVQQQDFHADQVISELVGNRTDVGAVVSFVGRVREFSGDQPLESMTLEHYPGMTEKALSRILDQAIQRWQLIDGAIVHRVGELRPAEQIVLAVALASHRKAAFQACDFMMDYLKVHAPFWKKERGAQGATWVEARDSDRQAISAWTPADGQ
jgi:molybdopterin synthase catalytic subunit